MRMVIMSETSSDWSEDSSRVGRNPSHSDAEASGDTAAIQQRCQEIRCAAGTKVHGGR
jgi:hypothetical protein